MLVGAVQETFICEELTIVPATEVGVPGVVAGTEMERVLELADATGAYAVVLAVMVSVPAAAVPLNAIVMEVALLKVTDEAVREVVPYAKVKSDVLVVVSKFDPLIVTVGFDAPFAMVSVVEILGAETVPTV